MTAPVRAVASASPMVRKPSGCSGPTVSTCRDTPGPPEFAVNRVGPDPICHIMWPMQLDYIRRALTIAAVAALPALAMSPSARADDGGPVSLPALRGQLAADDSCAGGSPQTPEAPPRTPPGPPPS